MKKPGRNRGKQRNLDVKRSGECSGYECKDKFYSSDKIEDWYEGKSKIANRAPFLF